MVYHVYILRCADESLYVGSAQKLEACLKAHNDGRGATYTFKHRAVLVSSISRRIPLNANLWPESGSSSAGVVQRKKR